MRKSDLLIYKQWGEKPKVLTKTPLLPAQEVPLLLKRAQEGDKQAQEKLILCNLRLVLSIIRRYKGKGVDYEDLKQQGRLALLEAIHKYDFNKGAKFSTYAYKKINGDILVLFKTNSLVNPSNYRQKQIQAYKKAMVTLEKELERMPSLEEIAHKMNTSEKSIILLHQYDTCIEMYKTVDELCDKIDKYAQDDEEDQLADPDKRDLVDQIISGKLSQLTDFERNLLIVRYQLGQGILTKGPLSFRDAAKILGVSHVYLHGIENNLMRKLRRLFTDPEDDD